MRIQWVRSQDSSLVPSMVLRASTPVTPPPFRSGTEAKSFAGLSCATCLEKQRLWPAHEQRVRSNLGVHHLPLDYSLHSVKISKSKLPCHRRLRGDADVRRCVAHGRGRGAEPLSTSCAVYNGADSPQLRGSTGAIFSLKAHLSGCLHLQSD
mmetsp:Transcript_24431/g.50994  ORF Transcript_24431/g.50994 Transcript_24431/m.50994 type:complete len:152 (-) Transcript_24431:37-492(-)